MCRKNQKVPCSIRRPPALMSGDRIVTATVAVLDAEGDVIDGLG